MTRDDDIIFRVFSYGYAYAERNKIRAREGCVLEFPEPKIIYLYSESPLPDEYVLELDFRKQGTFLYRVPTVKYLELSTEELNRKKMVALIPFSLLRLRKIMEEKRSKENLEVLKKLIQDDILGSIKENQRVGNLTVDDARRLKSLTLKLYQHIYSHYEEMEELNEMTDESLMLDIDIIEKEHEKEMERLREEKDRQIEEKNLQMEEKNRQMEENDKRMKEKMLKLEEEKNKEIAALKKQLEQLKNL